MKNRMVAALLAIFLGAFGMHKFYLGKTGWGIVYLLACWTLIPALIGLFEGLSYLMMSDVDFYKKYGESEFAILSDGIATPETHVRCPDCRELVRKDARKCKHCGTALIPQG